MQGIAWPQIVLRMSRCRWYNAGVLTVPCLMRDEDFMLTELTDGKLS